MKTDHVRGAAAGALGGRAPVAGPLGRAQPHGLPAVQQREPGVSIKWCKSGQIFNFYD